MFFQRYELLELVCIGICQNQAHTHTSHSKSKIPLISYFSKFLAPAQCSVTHFHIFTHQNLGICVLYSFLEPNIELLFKSYMLQLGMIFEENFHWGFFLPYLFNFEKLYFFKKFAQCWFMQIWTTSLKFGIILVCSLEWIIWPLSMTSKDESRPTNPETCDSGSDAKMVFDNSL